MAAAVVSGPATSHVRDGVLLVEYPERSDEEANRAAVMLGRRLREKKKPGLLDAVPGARTLLVVFDAETLGTGQVERLVAASSGQGAEPPASSRAMRLPVVYDGEDLGRLARAAGMSADELARRHAAGRYRVAFLGFAPGFAYLSGLPRELAAARLTTPRPRVPAGSVAIGGTWTGIYPAALPGGWRLIGRTSVRLFDPRSSPPSLLEPGDVVEFERVVGELPPLPASAREPGPEGRPLARVLAPGFFTTVQGAARPGRGSSGVPPGGAMDEASLSLANAVVGNAPEAPALEIAVGGLELELDADALLAAAGGEASIERNGEPVSTREALPMRGGDRIRVGRITRGARVYLAVQGGVAGEPGRRLAAGEALGTGSPPPGLGRIRREATDLGDEVRVRVMRGPEAGLFASGEIEKFLRSPWSVTAESDRRGLRLSGEALAHGGSPEIPPSGTVPGSIQVPGSGLPIVLGPDGPVTGGYPRIATVISADLPLLGQARPGTVLRFEAVSLAQALAARRRQGSTIGLP